MITCTFENGNKASLRHVVVDSLVLKDDRVLLVKRSGKLLEGGKWGLPGGFVDRDETIKQAVAREIKEETGYEVADITLFRIIDRPDRPAEDRQNISFVHLCAAGQCTGKPDWESDDVQRFPLSALPEEGEFAFDHYSNIRLYRKYLAGRVVLPVLG
ncbi:MAG TPA: NUDIX hydrolase [Reyranella sp.]|jgi:ADP-ribose pyrophosphatase YjhB (NUDIX family)